MKTGGKKGFKLLIGLLALVLLIGLTGKTGIAKNKKKLKIKIPKIYQELDLTIEQKRKLESIYRKIFTKETLMKMRDIKKKIKKGAGDPEELKKEYKKLTKPLNKKFRKEANKVLTKEQKEKLKEIKKARRNKRRK